MKVTDIKQQVKRAGRYSVYIDGAYVFSLGEAELLRSGLRIGREYTAAELEELKRVAVADKAYMRALDYLARRPRSRWEVEDYLRRKQYDSPTIDAILNTLSIKGYVDDAAFAEAWVRSRRQLKPTSLRRLRQELLQKRVDEEVITQVLAQDNANQNEGAGETETIRQLAAKKRSQPRYQDDQKLIAYLLRQGFRYDDIKTALQDQS